MMKINRLIGWPLVFLLGFSPYSWSQDEEEGGGGNNRYGFEAGFHLGNILPNQIPGMTEIMGLGGLRFATAVARNAFVEGGVTAGNGEGVQWKDIYTSIRLDVPVENIVGSVYLGPDVIYYQPVNQSNKLFGGGHFGGGMMIQLGGSTWFRMDMKFNINPGTSLYIAAGVVFRFPETGGGGD